MRCKSEWLHFPISPQQQASLPVRRKWGKIKTNINYQVREKKCSFYPRKPNYTTPSWMCLLLWFVLNMPLTIHLDLECDGCICQVTPGVEGVLALFLGIHSLQLQSSMVSNGIKNRTKRVFKQRKRGMSTESEVTNSVVWIQTVPMHHRQIKNRTCFMTWGNVMTLVFPVRFTQNAPTAYFKSRIASSSCSTFDC